MKQLDLTSVAHIYNGVGVSGSELGNILYGMKSALPADGILEHPVTVCISDEEKEYPCMKRKKIESLRESIENVESIDWLAGDILENRENFLPLLIFKAKELIAHNLDRKILVAKSKYIQDALDRRFGYIEKWDIDNILELLNFIKKSINNLREEELIEIFYSKVNRIEENRIKNLFDTLSKLYKTYDLHLIDTDLTDAEIGLSKQLNAICDILIAILSEEQKNDSLRSEIEKLCAMPNENIALLGEYISKEHKIVLYMKNIIATDAENADSLTKIVFMHEMVHAMIDSGDDYISEIEEPIAECGMLYFCQKMYPDLMDYALAHVRKKQNTVTLAHYGYGYYLYIRCSVKVNAPLLYIMGWKDKKGLHHSTVQKAAAVITNAFAGTYPMEKQEKLFSAFNKLYGKDEKEFVEQS